jgi:hypothetical protein
MARPTACICRFIVAMLSCVHFAGGTPLFIAAFSAGSPNASQPIGVSMLYPCIRRYRYIMSPIV